MADFSFITERLVCGAAINGPADIAALQAAGITHICDAREEANDGSFLAAGIGYVWDPTADDGQHPKPSWWFATAIDFALSALYRQGAIVMCHCAGGVNRGPSLAYTILRAQGMPATDAINLIHAKRPVTNGGIAYAGDAELALKQLGWTK